ncbi:MAG: FecR domain-containing protein [Pseudomonadota bacterium]|nr:FecR domain-containing protein [Pseudomonadota bacterium]
MIRTRAGDTLSSIATRYTSATSNWQQIGKLNGISRDTNIPIGTALQIPATLLADEPGAAQVAALFGTVLAVGSDRQPISLKAGSAVHEGDELTTGSNSFVTLALPDASRLSIPSNSHVRLSKLRMARYTKSPRTEITILHGALESEVSPLGHNLGRFEVRTPRATAAVRGTHFRVAVLADGSTSNELLSGVLAVTHNASQQQILLQHGEGDIVGAHGIGATRPLLDAPQLRASTVAIGSDVAVLEVTPIPAARAYHLQLRNDGGVSDTYVEMRSPSPAFRMSARDLADGNYTARVSAIDAAGLEGVVRVAPIALTHANGAAVSRSGAPVSDATAPSAPRLKGFDDKQLELAWNGAPDLTYTVQLARDADFTWLQANASTRAATLSLPRPPFGTYYARVRAEDANGKQSRYSPTQALVVTDQWVIEDGRPTPVAPSPSAPSTPPVTPR